MYRLLRVIIPVTIVFHSCVLSDEDRETSIQHNDQYDSNFSCDSLVYTFLNEILNVDSTWVIEQDICIDCTLDGITINGKRHQEIDTGKYVYTSTPILMDLDHEDTLFLNQQLRTFEKKKWDLKRLKSERQFIKYMNWMSSEGFSWEGLHNQGINGIISLGLPIFNKDMNEAIMFFGWASGGTIGRWYLYRYSLVNGKWIRIEEKLLIMS